MVYSPHHYNSSNTTTLPSGKNSREPPGEFIYSSFPKTSQQRYQMPPSFQDPDLFIRSYPKEDEIFTTNENIEMKSFQNSEKMKKEEISLYPMEEEPEGVATKRLDWNSLMSTKVNEEEESTGEITSEKQTDFSEGKSSKKGNKVVNVSLKPLGKKLVLTIPPGEIAKYLKDNEIKVADENKKIGQELQESIIKTISKLAGINEKTLRRISANGPERKKG